MTAAILIANASLWHLCDQRRWIASLLEWCIPINNQSTPKKKQVGKSSVSSPFPPMNIVCWVLLWLHTHTHWLVCSNCISIFFPPLLYRLFSRVFQTPSHHPPKTSLANIWISNTKLNDRLLVQTLHADG